MSVRQLQHLASLYGIENSYHDNFGGRKWAEPEILIRVLRSLGAPVQSITDVPEALQSRRLDLARRVLEPVSICWDDRPPAIEIVLPHADVDQSFQADLVFELGETKSWSGPFPRQTSIRKNAIDKSEYLVHRLTIPFALPTGYHRLDLLWRDRRASTLVIAAPKHAYAPPNWAHQKLWGTFLPLYSLFRKDRWESGVFSDLTEMMKWVASFGGQIVGTLPLLAKDWRLSEDPSPYSPASRLFWNEFHLDLQQVIGFRECTRAQELLAQADRELPAGATGDERVDYPRDVRIKRQILEVLCSAFFNGDVGRDRFRQYLASDPEVETYARFRAAGEKRRTAWPNWPEPMRSGKIADGDFDLADFHYHLFVQWQAHEQLGAVSRWADQQNMLWYLDVPLGVGRNGYDTWRNPSLFALDVDCGAPPDGFFTAGQNWGFPPPQPERMRLAGHEYTIATLRRHLEFARLLRLDHVMGLHRMFWIPAGVDATEGVYVRYPREENFAILSVESHRRNAVLVGENLGTVPQEIYQSLADHQILGMYVMQFDFSADGEYPFGWIPSPVVASLNTHDTPTFACYWSGLEVDDRVKLGLVAPDDAADELYRRHLVRNRLLDFLRQSGLLGEDTFDPEVILEALLSILGGSNARIVLVNLEDLWRETQPQNTPGTYRERPNWVRRARLSFDEWRTFAPVQRILKRLAANRKGG